MSSEQADADYIQQLASIQQARRDALDRPAQYGRGGTPTTTAHDDDAPAAPLNKDEDRCQHCGNGDVTKQFRRVFGDRADVLWACFECHTYCDVVDGAGWQPDWEPTGDYYGRQTDAYRGGQ